MMKDTFSFWKGVTAGLFGGIVIGALTRLSAAEAARFRNGSKEVGRRRLYPVADAPVVGHDPGPAPRKLRLRRDGAESAGDPRMTGPVRTPDAISGRAFERPPGAPGGQTPAELLEAPGRPGQYMDHDTRRHIEDEKSLSAL